MNRTPRHSTENLYSDKTTEDLPIQEETLKQLNSDKMMSSIELSFQVSVRKHIITSTWLLIQKFTKLVRVLTEDMLPKLIQKLVKVTKLDSQLPLAVEL